MSGGTAWPWLERERMSDPTKPQFIEPVLMRRTRIGHGAPLHAVPSERKTKVGVAPAPRPQPPAVPAEAMQRKPRPVVTAAPLPLIRRKADDAFSSRVTDKLPDARLIPAAARAAFAGTWGVTLQGPVEARVEVPEVVAVEAPRGLRAWAMALLGRVRAALRRE